MKICAFFNKNQKGGSLGTYFSMMAVLLVIGIISVHLRMTLLHVARVKETASKSCLADVDFFCMVMLSRKRRAFHGSSSTSSSSSGEMSGDERRFQRRKAKSMNKSRSRFVIIYTCISQRKHLFYFCLRCLPMNLKADDITSGILKDRVKIGASLADIDPMSIDKNVSTAPLLSVMDIDVLLVETGDV
jgi:hypothetical protein